MAIDDIIARRNSNLLHTRIICTYGSVSARRPAHLYGLYLTELLDIEVSSPDRCSDPELNDCDEDSICRNVPGEGTYTCDIGSSPMIIIIVVSGVIGFLLIVIGVVVAVSFCCRKRKSHTKAGDYYRQDGLKMPQFGSSLYMDSNISGKRWSNKQRMA